MSNVTIISDACPPSRIPLWVKLAYSVFVCVLVPHYLYCYGPTNFLYYCDIALLMTLVAVWREDALWASMPAVGILLPQTFWIADLLCRLVGVPISGMTAYMFKSSIPLFTRGLSLFHFWLPLFLIWIIWRLGYDRRAFWTWTALAWVLMLICYFLIPAPPAPTDNPNLPVNINYVYGMSDSGPQTMMPSLAYLTLLMIGLPICVFLPTHLILRSLFHPSEC
jgi:hypothetical protein